MRTIAAAAGVSQPAVSLALRNHPRIGEATRRRVREIAVRLGYQADGRLAELMQHLRMARTGAYRETLAFVADEVARPLCAPGMTWWRQLDGARRRALELGFHLDEWWLGRDGLDDRRVGEILRARGVRGLIVGPLLRPGLVDRLPWDRHATVVLNYTLSKPALNRVASSQIQTITDALTEVAARGYRRIGLVISPQHDARVRRLWTTGYFGFFGRNPSLQPLPVFWGETEAAFGTRDDKAFLTWFRRQRVEAMLTLSGEWVVALREAGLRCPVDYGCVMLDRPRQGDYAGFSGVDQHHEEIGAMAVEQLSGALQRGEFGLPAHPRTTLLYGTWLAGSSLVNTATRDESVGLRKTGAPHRTLSAGARPRTPRA